MFVDKTGKVLDIIEVDCQEPKAKDGKVQKYDFESGRVYQQKDYSGFVFNKLTAEKMYNDDAFNIPDGYTDIKPTHVGQSFNDSTKTWSVDINSLKHQKIKDVNDTYNTKLEELKQNQMHGLIEFWSIIESEINLYKKRKREKDVPFLVELSRHSKNSINVLIANLEESMQNLKTELAFLMGKRQALLSTINNANDKNQASIKTLMTLTWD